MSTPIGTILPPAERAFGKYELIFKLATGGMAEVFIGRERAAAQRKLVVIKRVLPYLVEEPRFLAMFRDEARLASQIIHPNVCRVLDSGIAGETDYIAMEYLHGVPLSRMLVHAASTKEFVPVDVLVALIVDCARGLHFAHELVSSDNHSLEVVHRDVSPPNILVTVEGRAKMLDFGVAKARGATQKTRTGMIKGKNSYMSPEQILGQEVDRRSDIFSLGVVLWEALCNERLFSRDSEFKTLTAITEADIPSVQALRPQVSDELHKVLLKALAKERGERYATAEDFAGALTEALASYGGLPSPSQVGAYIQAHFSKELASKQHLMQNVTQQMAAIAAPIADEAYSPPPPRKDASSFDSLTLNLRVPRGSSAPESAAMPGKGKRHRGFLTGGLAVGVGLLVAVIVWMRAGAQDGEPVGPRVVFVYRDAGFADAASAWAYLSLQSSEPAVVYVDGRKLGHTPIDRAELPPGRHKLRAVSDSGATQTMDLDLQPNKSENLGQLMW